VVDGDVTTGCAVVLAEDDARVLAHEAVLLWPPGALERGQAGPALVLAKEEPSVPGAVVRAGKRWPPADFAGDDRRASLETGGRPDRGGRPDQPGQWRRSTIFLGKTPVFLYMSKAAIRVKNSSHVRSDFISFIRRQHATRRRLSRG